MTTTSAGSSPLIVRRCACGRTPRPDGECAACKAKRLRRQAGPPLAPPIVHDVLRSAGRPLEPSVRGEMEARFGHDFSRVRVHTDARAAESARAVGALAYTVGRDVVFGAGRYAPAAPEGGRLLAHELTHVVQQAHGPRAGHLAGLRVADARDQTEAEAAAAASGVPGSRRLSMHRRGRLAHPVLQRQESKPPLIPIPVFEELDPMVIVPDLPGVPSFLRGQTIKLSDLRKALDIARGGLPSLGGGGEGDICSTLLPGHEMVRSGELSGLCCPKFSRMRERCCRWQDIAPLDFRCCGGDEVVIGGRCVRPGRAPTPPAPRIPAVPTPTPTPTPVPGRIIPPLPTLEPPTTRIRFGTIQSATIDHFDSESAALPPDASATLDLLATQINLYRDATVHVDGHTDSTHTRAFNRRLSQQRAEAVRDELVRRGVERSRLILQAYGEDQLLFPEERTEEEKARNRRVDVWLYIPPTEPLSESLRLPPFPGGGMEAVP